MTVENKLHCTLNLLNKKIAQAVEDGGGGDDNCDGGGGYGGGGGGCGALKCHLLCTWIS